MVTWRPPGGMLGPIYLVCLAALLLSSALLTFISTRSHLRSVSEAQRQIGKTVYMSVAHVAEDALRVGETLGSPANAESFERVSQEVDVLRLEIVDNAGALLYANDDAQVSRGPMNAAGDTPLAPADLVHRFWRYRDDFQSAEAIERLAIVDAFGSGRLASQVLGPVEDATGRRLATVSVLIDLDPVKRSVRNVAFYSGAAIFGTGLLLSVLLGLMLNLFVQRPLRRLQQATERVARGDRSARVRAGRSDELGRLARSFNTMAIRVHEATAALESRVGERTEELHAANLKLNEALSDAQRRAARLQVLNEIGRRLAATLQLDELYPIVHAQCRRVLPVDSFYIALYQPASETITFPYLYDNGPVESGNTWPLGDGPTSHVIRTRQPYLATSSDDLLQQRGDAFGDTERRSGSALHVPLIVGDRVIGALSVQSYGTGDYDQEDVGVLVTIARQTAVAMENVRLYSEAQTRERRLVEMVAATPDTVVVGDAERNLALVNSAAERMLGYEAAALIGQPLRLLFPDDLRNDGRGMLAKLAAEGLVRDWQTYAVARDGERIPVSVSLGMLRGSGATPDGLVAIARDLRDRRRLEQQLVQAERLSAVGGLVAGVAHELNNPLTTVLGFSELLLRSDLPGSKARDVHYIHQAAERCKRIVADLLSFARAPKSGRLPEDFNRLVQRVLALMGYAMRGAGVTVKLSLDPSLHFVALDPHQIQQVLFNLLQNALQAMEHSERARWVEVSTERRDSMVRVRVADNGPGIPPEYLHRVFEPFFSTKDVGQGTGLGLSLAYSTVREHGGTIEARNVPGAGAEFVVELPYVAQAPPREDHPAEEPAALMIAGRRHILVVDDEESVRRLLEVTLSQLGFTVNMAPDGVAALRLLERHTYKYDIVLADVRMPGLGGAELYHHISEQAPDLARRVIFITGDTISPDTRAFLESTGLPTVVKPFRAADIQTTIAATLSAVAPSAASTSTT